MPLRFYALTAWLRIALATFIAARAIVGFAAGGNVVVPVLALFVAAFFGSIGIWMLQGIHVIRRERAARAPATSPAESDGVTDERPTSGGAPPE